MLRHRLGHLTDRLDAAGTLPAVAETGRALLEWTARWDVPPPAPYPAYRDPGGA